MALLPKSVRLLESIRSHSPLIDKGLYRSEIAGKTGAGGDVLFALDSQEHLHLLVPIPPGTDVSEDRRSEGVWMIRRELDEGGARQLFVDLMCRNTELHGPFHALVDDVLAELESSSRRPDLIVHTVLEKWRALLQRGTSVPLGKNQLAGLFAELAMLETLCEKNLAMIDSWTGPLGQRHDFAIRNTSIEVKASLSSQRRSVRIHGLDQLEPPVGGQLYLCHYRLEYAKAARCVPDVIDALLQTGVSRNELSRRLAEVGYFATFDAIYRETRFRVVDVSTYRISEGFPRISRATFIPGALSPAITDIHYTLDLEGAQEMRLQDSEWHSIVREMVTG